MDRLSFSISFGGITGLLFYLLSSGLRNTYLRMTLALVVILGITLVSWIALEPSFVLAAPESSGGMNLEPVSTEQITTGMSSLAKDISNLAKGMSVPMTLILLFLAIIVFVFAVLFKKLLRVATGFLLMAIVFFLIFGDLEGAVNFVIGTLDWIKSHF